MKKFLFTAMMLLICLLSGTTAGAQSKLDKLVGTWLMKSDMNGQTMEIQYKIEKIDGAVFAIMEMPGTPTQKLEIKEADGKLSSVLEIPEYGATIAISYTIVDDDNVKVTVDAGGFVMENPMTRVK